MEEDLKRLQEQINTIQADLRQVAAFLRAAIPSPVIEIEPVELSLDGAPTKGNINAPIVIAEFSDFQCPFCGQHYRTTYRKLIKEFVDTGQASYVFKNLPLQPLHPNAPDAAEAAQCAGQQSKFWEMHDRLFEHQDALNKSALRSHAQEIGLGISDYDACIATGIAATRVREDVAEATRLGLSGTPTFLIGVRSGTHVTFAWKINGVQQLATFEAALASARVDTRLK